MKASVVVQFLSIVTLAVTQSTPSPPACALPCLEEASTKSGCGTSDYICQCTTGKQAITASVTSCLIKSSCTGQDFNQLSAFAATFCPKVLADASASSSGQTQTTGSATKGSGSSQTGSASSSLATAATGSSTATGSSATQSPNSAQSYQGSALEAVAISFFAVACGFLGLR